MAIIHTLQYSVDNLKETSIILLTYFNLWFKSPTVILLEGSWWTTLQGLYSLKQAQCTMHHSNNIWGTNALASWGQGSCLSCHLCTPSTTPSAWHTAFINTCWMHKQKKQTLEGLSVAMLATYITSFSHSSYTQEWSLHCIENWYTCPEQIIEPASKPGSAPLQVPSHHASFSFEFLRSVVTRRSSQIFPGGLRVGGEGHPAKYG